MQPEQIPITEPQRRILEILRTEFFPLLNDLKSVLVKLQATKIFFGVYSPLFTKVEQEYFGISEKLFALDRKLTTPDILFEGLPNMKENVLAYYIHAEGIKQTISESSRYIEIIDRTLDRKRQTLQNNRTFLVAIIALIISLWPLVWPVNIGNHCYSSAYIGEKLTHESCIFIFQIGKSIDLKWDTSRDFK